MKILYFGTVCDMENYNQILKNCKVKPSVATVVFETALLDGFKKNGAEVEIHSFPMIPTYPKSKLLRFGKNAEKLSMGYTCRWLHTVNIPVLKQISRRLDGRKMLKRWLKENKKGGVVLTYSIPPFLVKDILKYCKKYSVKVFAIVPDLLRDMYINEKAHSAVTRLKNRYIKPALKMQGEYDGYIYLTDAMHEVVAPDKPYIVMEGIAQIAEHTPAKKATPRAVMYAGMLHEKYGIINLADAFEALADKDTELWLFGDGTAAEEIKRRAAANPKIKYFGSVPRDTILEYEKKATLLVNPRDPLEEFTFYSFASKNIEYMLSGTPFLTTKLRGIPTEYFNYVFTAENNSVSCLKKAIADALSHTDAELKEMGMAAREFIVKAKNSKKQVSRIIKFLNEV